MTYKYICQFYLNTGFGFWIRAWHILIHLSFSGIIAAFLITTEDKKSVAATALLTPSSCFYFAMLCLWAGRKKIFGKQVLIPFHVNMLEVNIDNLKSSLIKISVSIRLWLWPVKPSRDDVNMLLFAVKRINPSICTKIYFRFMKRGEEDTIYLVW